VPFEKPVVGWNVDRDVASLVAGTPADALEDTNLWERDVAVASMSIRRLLLDTGVTKSRRAYRAVMAAGFSYWVSMVAIYFSVDIGCGTPVPKLAFLIYFFMNIFCLLCEIWVIVQCKSGYVLFTELRRNLFAGIALGQLGRFDTFGDVTNAVAIQTCALQDRELYSWFSVWGHNFPLPADLGTLMTIALAFIAVFQLLPAIVLLVRGMALPTSLKLNELTLVLAVMEEEVRSSQRMRQPLTQA